jgi:hypothetical protein
MPEVDGRPLHEKVFQIKAAIRRAGFVASGRTRMDKDGRVVMGVIVPTAFPAGDLTVEQVHEALKNQVVLRSGGIAFTDARLNDGTFEREHPPDLRTAAGRRWKREHAGASS